MLQISHHLAFLILLIFVVCEFSSCTSKEIDVIFRDAYVKELQTVNLSTKRKAELIESQMNDCEKYRNALDNYLRDIHSQIDSIRGMDQ